MEVIRRTSYYSNGKSHTEYYRQCLHCKLFKWFKRKTTNRYCSRECSNIALRTITNPKEFFFREKLTRLKHNAKRRGKPISLTWQDLFNQYKKQNGNCYYTGISMLLTFSAKVLLNCPPEQLSVDRLDNTLGYTKDNIVLCCFCINNFKGEMTLDEFKLFINKIKSYESKD